MLIINIFTQINLTNLAPSKFINKHIMYILYKISTVTFIEVHESQTIRLFTQDFSNYFTPNKNITKHN